MAQALFAAETAEHRHLLEAAPIVPDATVSKPLLNQPACRAVLFAMDAGQSMSEHRTPFLATVQVLDGRLRFGIDGASRELAAHDLMVIPADAPHDLDALEPTRFLLTIIKVP